MSQPTAFSRSFRMLVGDPREFRRAYKQTVHRRERRRAREALHREDFERAEVEEIRLDDWAIC